MAASNDSESHLEILDLNDKVLLRCVKEGSRLRVKVITKGFSHDANCQFPKNIRVVGREYLVPRSDITMSGMRGKFFYRVKKNNIEIRDDNESGGAARILHPSKNLTSMLSTLTVYEDPELMDCVVCMEEKDHVVGFMIYVPCGHACVCKTCSKKLKECPMCRAPILQKITKDDLQ